MLSSSLMITTHINNPRSIKFDMKKFLSRLDLKGKAVLDFPAGDGATSEQCHRAGAEVIALDLFPEYFKCPDVVCSSADISNGIPLVDGSVDIIICQEGIEHFTNQLAAFKEFSRVLKPGGKLIITTPSQSCLASKLAHFIFETEHTRRMPPNEIDDIWRDDQARDQTYHGHLFLLGAQKLRTLAAISRLHFDSFQANIISKGSLVLFPFA